MGYTALHKKQKEYAIALACTRCLEDGVCKIYFTSRGKQPVNNMDENFAFVSSVIDGIQLYTKNELAKEDSLLKHQYTVVVDTLVLPGAAFTGMVRVKEKLHHTVKGVKMGYQLFTPDYRGNTIVLCNDAGKGRIEKKAELILLSGIGRQVSIPFLLTWNNK